MQQLRLSRFDFGFFFAERGHRSQLREYTWMGEGWGELREPATGAGEVIRQTKTSPAGLRRTPNLTCRA